MKSAELPLELCAEYDAAADWCAAHGLTGQVGDALPANMASDGALYHIQLDPEAFAERVRECAYARAMSRIEGREG